MDKRKSSIPYFSIVVKKRLVELDMTQRELADEVGMDEKYLTEILRGRRSGAKYKQAITEILGLDRDKCGDRREVI